MVTRERTIKLTQEQEICRREMEYLYEALSDEQRKWLEDVIEEVLEVRNYCAYRDQVDSMKSLSAEIRWLDDEWAGSPSFTDSNADLLLARQGDIRKRRVEVMNQIKALSKVDNDEVLARIESLRETRMSLGIRRDILNCVALKRGMDIPCDAHYRGHLEQIDLEFGPILPLVC